MLNKRFILILLILFLVSTTFVNAGLLTWIKEFFGVTGKVVVDVQGSKDYCPEIGTLQQKVDNFEAKARVVLKNAGSCLDNNDCNALSCLDSNGDGFYICE